MRRDTPAWLGARALTRRLGLPRAKSFRVERSLPVPMRDGAVLLVTLMPAGLFTAAMLALGEGTVKDNLVSFARATGGAVIISVMMGVCSVGFSALNRSRAFTFSAWVLLFFVPWGLATLVQLVSEWPWLRLAAHVQLHVSW